MAKNAQGFEIFDMTIGSANFGQNIKGVCSFNYKGYEISLSNAGVFAVETMVSKDGDELFFRGNVEEVLAKVDAIIDMMKTKSLYDYTIKNVEEMILNYEKHNKYSIKDKIAFLVLSQQKLTKDLEDFKLKVNSFDEIEKVKKLLIKRKQNIYSVKMKDIKTKIVKLNKIYSLLDKKA